MGAYPFRVASLRVLLGFCDGERRLSLGVLLPGPRLSLVLPAPPLHPPVGVTGAPLRLQPPSGHRGGAAVRRRPAQNPPRGGAGPAGGVRLGAAPRKRGQAPHLLLLVLFLLLLVLVLLLILPPSPRQARRAASPRQPPPPPPPPLARPARLLPRGPKEGAEEARVCGGGPCRRLLPQEAVLPWAGRGRPALRLPTQHQLNGEPQECSI